MKRSRTRCFAVAVVVVAAWINFDPPSTTCRNLPHTSDENYNWGTCNWAFNVKTRGAARTSPPGNQWKAKGAEEKMGIGMPGPNTFMAHEANATWKDGLIPFSSVSFALKSEVELIVHRIFQTLSWR